MWAPATGSSATTASRSEALAGPRGPPVPCTRLFRGIDRLREQMQRPAAPARPRQLRAGVAARASLASYTLPRREGMASEWFQAAVRDVVRHLDDSPFLQLVSLGGGRQASTSYAVDEAVVAAPKLWQGIAAHLSNSNPDVVILVQRVGTDAQDGGARAPSSGSGGPLQRAGDAEVAAEAACSRLVKMGVADAILAGHIGDCCDGEAAGSHEAWAAAHAGAAPSIVPFSPLATASGRRRRSAVRAAAISAAAGVDVGTHTHTGHWGLVVQSRLGHTGAEGCYILKAVRNMSATGCHCIHYNLTRVTSGEHLEAQFVRSWLV